MIDLAQRLTVGIAQAIDAFAQTFESGDYGEYRKAGKELRKVSRKADREMASAGLFYCAKAFNVIPL